MSFFEPKPPSKPREPLPEVAPWLQQPRWILGGTVGIRVVLATTPTMAVLAHGFTAYPEGVHFEVDMRPRARFARGDEELDLHQVLHPEYKDGDLSPTFFRFGIEFEDGTKLTNLMDEESRRALRDSDAPPDRPVLLVQGGGGAGHEFSARFWLWPLPGGAHLDLVCEWPAFGIPVSRARVETAPIVAATARARPYLGRGS